MDKLAALPLPLPAQDAGFGRPNISTRNAGAGELRQAAEEFEAMFVRMIWPRGIRRNWQMACLKAIRTTPFNPCSTTNIRALWQGKPIWA